MVFRGRLSKACQRCRDRRLRCDFLRPSCSSCIRAATPCVGYRDTLTIRIADETNDVRTKADARSLATQAQQLTYLPPSVEVTARDFFFANYVCEFSHTWAGLLKYHHTNRAPAHLSSSLDAVSLVFLALSTRYEAAVELSRRKYVAALRMINAELQRADAVKKVSTFEGALLLDLFEKMSKEVKEGAVVRHAHVEGALVLARLRGVEAFRERGEVKALLGLTLNATVCCLSARRKISEPIRKMREHAATVVDGADMNWRLSGVLSDVVDLVADIHANTLTLEENTARCARLDSCLEAISHEATSTWLCESVIVPAEHGAGSLPSDSPSLYNIYPSRAVMHTWNVLRLLRILLHEELISHFPTPTHSTPLLQPPPSITPTIRQICASVPQMIACSSVASHKLPPGSPCQQPHPPSSGLLHTIPHLLDAYILIFPLYVAGWSRYCSPPTRVWILDQLEYIGTHFGLMAANVVREVLLRETGSGGVESWVARRNQFDFVLSRHIADFYGLGL